MPLDTLNFSSIVFFSGFELLPDDLILGLDNIRRWAFDQGLIYDPEGQILVTERLQELAKYISSDDQPGIAIALEEEDTGISYMEYPHLSVRSLIRRNEEIRIVYWVMRPTTQDKGGHTLGEIRFGFWLSDCADEFCSVSNAKLVVEKFAKLLGELSSTYRVKTLKDGSKDITVEGGVWAKFRRAGRQFDVDITVAHEDYGRR